MKRSSPPTVFRLLPVVVTVAVLAILGACGSDDDASTAPTAPGAPATEASTTSAPDATATTTEPEDFDAQPDDFVHLGDMVPVRGFFIDNRLGHLDEALAVANNPDGGVYPVGTIIQLVPQEAMVKRGPGYSPEFADWEFFILEATPEGTEIVQRGGTEVLNRFGGSCAACHAKADVAFDMVCEEDNGCDPLPIGDDMFQVIQQADPRPRSAPATTVAP